MIAPMQLTFDALCAAHPDQRRVAHVGGEGGVTLTFGVTVVELPSDWPQSGIDRDFFESRGFVMFRVFEPWHGSLVFPGQAAGSI
ncbi:hypothetical protein [Paraburkholderia sp. J8-2]|uniref:hypothetical protein n=1 Tax=Paraburkholderia sp. J8-2 TaxID=2805440 RepID=UPI002AB6783C|nr:hypothetical protein [Paraburkholderia sp. J8-2]